ncbi:hypothetical protein PBR20603_04827 [Pandoraea bronchicola]|uniref:Uncharacterized protein n=1 Tax=Pandoraea bronchicola TaxID=2508287 RepID=A0A5E5C2P2_9BURK|nr:hypothetical protein PBR20603_04827 [Pandoraea bronchicola]
MPWFRLNGVGFTARCKCAYSQPEIAARTAAYTNTTTFIHAVFTPIASAMTPPPLSARMARPERESSRFLIDTTASTTTNQIR